MKVFGFVRQRSAAKFIMADLLDAFRHLELDYSWLDMEVWRKDVIKMPLEKRTQVIEKLISDIRNFKPDIIISYGLEAFYPLFSDIIDKSEKPFFHYFQEVPFLCFFFDFGSPYTDPGPVDSIPFITQMQSHQFMFLCWDKDAIKVLRDKGISKCVYFPMGVNEAVFKLMPLDGAALENYGCDFCFVGGPTPARVQLLEAIHDKNLKIYGYDQETWTARPNLKPHFQYLVFDRDELAKIYNASLASVNVTREHGKSSLNMRVYEAMACGALLLTDDKQDARELFTPDQEILVYTDENELGKTADLIIKNRNFARKIARRGRERILEGHTYFRRIQTQIPVIERFVQEFRALEEIAENINNGHLTDALGHLDCLIDDKQDPLNAELLYFIKHKILMAKGQIWSAKRFIDRSLSTNPFFIRAQKTKEQFE